ILFLLLGCVAFTNAFGIDLGFLSPSRDSGESPMGSKLCNPIETSNSERDFFQPTTSTINPGDVSTRRFLVPLPTLAPTSTSTTSQVNNVECDLSPAPAPVGIVKRFGSQLLNVFGSLF
ncbi:hypothetical protein KR084_005370, partial [Drosophila pseudotakahashii]